MNSSYTKQELYRAHLARDIRFDGQFFVAVKTTKIYCRPICPARKALLKNLEFFTHAAEAEEAGYRPCLRCRPETAPGSDEWIGTSLTVRRAIRMMENPCLEEVSIQQISKTLGISERWLLQLFQEQLGVNPQRFLLDKKLSTARNLLDHSDLSITDIALSSGFNSIRRFNDAFKKRFEKTPSSCKKNKTLFKQHRLSLRYRPPLNWDMITQFLSNRSINTMELVENNTYQRLFLYNGIPGWMKVSQIKDHQIQVDFKLKENIGILNFVTRIKEMFDLNADPMMIEQDLKKDSKLKPWLEKNPGLRIPGCWDGFELAVRAIIGQLISIKAAKTILNRLTESCGIKQHLDDSLPLTHFFPTPQNILDADLSKIGLTKTKEQSIKELARHTHNKELVLDGTADYNETCKKLLSIKGIGPWTVQYISMRGLKNPDAFPEKDLEVQKRIQEFNLDPKKWTPWRAYATILLFNLPPRKKP